MDMINIFGFQDDFFTITYNLNPRRNDTFHFAPGPIRFSTWAYNALPRSRSYCTAIFSGCNCPCGCCWWWWWYSVTVRICIIRATFAFILSSFFHTRKMHSYLFSSCLNVALRTKIVFFDIPLPLCVTFLPSKLHPIYDVIFKRYRFNWMDLVTY